MDARSWLEREWIPEEFRPIPLKALETRAGMTLAKEGDGVKTECQVMVTCATW